MNPYRPESCFRRQWQDMSPASGTIPSKAGFSSFPDASKGEANQALARKFIASASYLRQLSPLHGSQKSNSQLCSEAPERGGDSPNGDSSPQQRLKLTVADERTP